MIRIYTTIKTYKKVMKVELTLFKIEQTYIYKLNEAQYLLNLVDTQNRIQLIYILTKFNLP